MIPVTAVILTYNEKENVGRTLAALKFIPKVVIIDSGSTDGTIEVAQAAHPNMRVVQRPFDSHPNQWNFALDQVSTEWVLTLDADYEVSLQLAAEIAALNPAPNQIGFWAEFEYRIYGHPLRGSSYPPRIVLFRPSHARYVDDGHTQTLWIRDAVGELKPPAPRDHKTTGLQDNRTGRLTGKIYHDDRKPLSRWIQEQNRYSKLEARHLLAISKGHPPTRKATGVTRSATRKEELSVQDRLRMKIFFAAPVMFLYLLFVRGLILDGWPGWYYVAQRTIAELLLSMRLMIERHRLEAE